MSNMYWSSRTSTPIHSLSPPHTQATHIFDGLEDWPTHIMYVSQGQLKYFKQASELPELKQGMLLELIEKWLREDKAVTDAQRAAQRAEGGNNGEKKGGETSELATWNNGWAAGRLASTIKHASNTVWRM